MFTITTLIIYLIIAYVFNFLWLKEPRDEVPTQLGILFISSPLTFPLILIDRYWYKFCNKIGLFLQKGNKNYVYDKEFLERRIG